MNHETTPIVILGTGGNCIDILDTLLELNQLGTERFECIGFLDDDEEKQGRAIHGVKVLGGLDSAGRYPDARFVFGIGSPNNFWRRPEILARTGLAPDRFQTVIHPTASVSRLARLGRGVVVFQHATITSNVTLGDHVLILPNTVVSHDDVIGDYTCIAGGACISGGVTVGRACYIGTNAAIIGHVTIGNGSLVGMGSVVLEDVPPNSVVVGNPARFLRSVREADAPS